MASLYWIGGTSGDWSTAANWSTGSVPVSTDDVFLSNNSVDITLGLNQSAVTLASLTIDSSFTGKIAAAGTYLQINATTLNIGRQSNTSSSAGSSRLHLDGTFTTVNIIDTSSSSADSGLPPVCLHGTITTLNVRAGSLGVAVLTPVETATVTTINILQSDTASQAPTVTFGLVSNTTMHMEAGKLITQATATVTTATLVGGEYRVNGTSAHTTINVESGKLSYNGTGTITNLNVYAANADFSNDTRSKTITNCNLYSGATLNLQTGVKGSVTITNGVILNGCDLPAVKLYVGNDRTLSLS